METPVFANAKKALISLTLKAFRMCKIILFNIFSLLVSLQVYEEKTFFSGFFFCSMEVNNLKLSLTIIFIHLDRQEQKML